MTREAKIILILSVLFTIAMGFSGIFVNVFIWKATNDYTGIISYHLMQFIFLPLTFIVSGWLAKKWDGVWPLRIGIGLFILFFMVVLTFHDMIHHLLYPLGILQGLAGGFYWLALQVLVFDYTDATNRDTFNGFNGSITSIAGAVTPLISGLIISFCDANVGYYIVFTLTLIFFGIQIFVSFLIKPRPTAQTLCWDKLIHTNNPDWKLYQKSSFFWGLKNGIIIFVIQILIFTATGSELSLGKITFIAALLGAFAFWVEQKLIKPHHRAKSLLLGSVFMLISILGLLFKINTTTLLFYTFVDAIFLPFFLVPMTSAGFNALSFHDDEKFRIEYIINKDLFLNSGRTVSLLCLLLLLYFFNDRKVITYYLVFLGSVQFISYFYLRRLSFLGKS